MRPRLPSLSVRARLTLPEVFEQKRRIRDPDPERFSMLLAEGDQPIVRGRESCRARLFGEGGVQCVEGPEPEIDEPPCP